MQFLLYLFFGLLLVGNLVVLLIIQENSPFLEFLVRHHWYFAYHALLTFYLLPLGEYGRQLREKSFQNFCNDVGPILLKEINPHKAEAFNELKTGGGDNPGEKPFTVLEIGIGQGVNFSYYPEKCDLIAVEPVSACRKEISRKLKHLPGIQLKGFYTVKAEDLTEVVENESVDAVIGTMVLCSVGDIENVLQEVLRVLKPGGKYYFYEHVKSKPSWKRMIQDFLNWSKIWDYWMCGCDFHDTEPLIKNAGFTDVKGKEVHLKYSKFSLPLQFVDRNYYGVATK